MNLEIYNAPYPVSYFHVDPNGFLSTPALLYALQEVALDHCKLGGHDVATLKDANSGWAVLYWHIKINNLPQLWDKMELETWTNKHGRMQINRSYSVKNKGEEIIKIMSQWIMMDLEKRRPKTATEDFLQYCCDRESVLPTEKFFSVHKKEDLGDLLKESTREVKRSDIDTNDHVNNVKYVEWAIDDMPDEILDGYLLDEVRIIYRKECSRGDIVHLKTYKFENNITSIIFNSDEQKVAEIGFKFR